MNKNELLEELSLKIASGEITTAELQQFSQIIPASALVPTAKLGWHFSVTKMLYFIGAAIVVVGLIIFVQQIWEDIGAFGRILVTLGLGLLFAGLGSSLLKKNTEDGLGSVFHFMGGMLIPSGALVVLTELYTSIDTLWPIAITIGMTSLFYLALNSVHKNALITFFTIANCTSFLYLIVGAIVGDSYYSIDKLYQYLTMLTGVCYLLLAQSFQNTWNHKLVGSLHFFGSTGILFAAFMLVLEFGIWELLYFALIAGGLFLAVYMKSKIVLIMTTIFLIVHVAYITSEYFADSLGWPISLVLLGFIFIGLGYASISINKKYIS